MSVDRVPRTSGANGFKEQRKTRRVSLCWFRIFVDAVRQLPEGTPGPVDRALKEFHLPVK